MQEVITLELARKIQEYERELGRWRTKRRVERRGAAYAAVIAVPLWVVSYLMSTATGPVNQAQWFTMATILSFVGAVLASGMAIVLGGFLATDVRPERPVGEKDIS